MEDQKEYFVEIQHSIRPETIKTNMYNVAVKLYNEFMQAGTIVNTYYIQNGKKYNTFTEEEIEE